MTHKLNKYEDYSQWNIGESTDRYLEKNNAHGAASAYNPFAKPMIHTKRFMDDDPINAIDTLTHEVLHDATKMGKDPKHQFRDDKKQFEKQHNLWDRELYLGLSNVRDKMVDDKGKWKELIDNCAKTCCTGK